MKDFWLFRYIHLTAYRHNYGEGYNRVVDNGLLFLIDKLNQKEEYIIGLSKSINNWRMKEHNCDVYCR